MVTKEGVKQTKSQLSSNLYIWRLQWRTKSRDIQNYGIQECVYLYIHSTEFIWRNTLLIPENDIRFCNILTEFV